MQNNNEIIKGVVDYSYEQIRSTQIKTQEALLNWIDTWVPKDERKAQIIAVKVAMEPQSKEEYIDELERKLDINL